MILTVGCLHSLTHYLAYLTDRETEAPSSHHTQSQDSPYGLGAAWHSSGVETIVLH